MTFCQLCKQRFSTEEDFKNHCFTVEHRRLIFEDASAQWKHRDPPQTYKNLKLCERSLTCEYGDNCMKAHSKEELKEWKKRIKDVRKRAKNASYQGLLSYQDDLLEEYRQSKDKEKIVSDFMPDVSVTCPSDLDCVNVRDTGIPNTWNFTIISKEPLEVVALLRRNIGAKFTLNKDHHTEQTYSTGDWFLTKSSTDQKEYEVPVSFTSDQLGMYEQWLVFDFNKRPVLRRTLKIRVGKDMERCAEETTALTPEPKVLRRQSALLPVNFEPWSEERMKIIHFPQREEAERELLNKYKLVFKHQMNRPITRENYKESMHSFLYQEEKKEGELLARLNQRGSMQLRNHLSDTMFGLKIAPKGELFASVDLSQSLTPDTPQGYIMKRNAVRILVHVVETDDHHTPVYETKLIKDTATDSATETQIHILLSKQCCSDLNLQNEQKCEIEIQFHLNRLWFCQMHKAIDDLPDVDQVLPNLKNCNIQVPDQSNMRDLNENQKAAMNFIRAETDNRCSVPPLLIYGPFGTGKTLTLAKMAQDLVQQPSNKILICTHTNSSADLYVLRHFHTFVTDHPEARLLRIKTKEKNLKSTDLITLQYCYLSKDGHHFEFPDKAVLDSTRIIITTTAMACYFHNMRLPENYFSHILIDEASQMLECEALMALGLAGKKTRVVLAGDHMQMGPKLFSVTQDECSQYTLLNRLFYHYQAENSSAAKQSRIIFTENYRSTKDIVDFVSTHFYVGKSDVIKARGDVPSHPDQHALQFHHVRGKCYLDSTRSSWFNHEESQSVVDTVKKIRDNWPSQWCEQDSTSICVLSQGAQVYTIRQRLRDLGLARITVENAENVQGKQFRVIVISTVHTKDSLLRIDQSYLEFFNDMRVLNTVMTRAQSQIVVVGDAAALSSPNFGTCWRLWRSYIEHCINKESAYDLAEDFWKQDLLEISELCRNEGDVSSDCESIISEISDIDDPILQELLDENKDINISLTEEGLFTVSHEHVVGNVVSQNKEVGAEQQCGLNIHKRCEIVTERFDQGYAIPLDEPTRRIDIRGRQNMGQSFPGDKVRVEILNEHSNPPMGKVIQVLESADTLKEFVCTLERHDSQVMRPINKRISNIFTPFWKDKPNHIAVRYPGGDHTIQKFIKVNEETRRNYLFVVRICKWRKRFRLPLGIVVRVFQKVASLKDGLDVLDIEFQLRRTLSEDVKREMQDCHDFQVFEDGRKDFRDLPTFTIDSEVSKDLDDAISVNDLGDCYEIGVHISDVASFVRKDSELDKYARKQGTTFYPPDREPRHMFPEELSVNFFSLIPGKDRQAISLIIEVDKKTDHIKKRSFVKSIICSKRRFSYSEVDDILEKQVDDQHFDILVMACHFADVHRKYRKQKDWHYKSPDENVPIGRRRSHRMVEELMIMFNHTVAERLLYDKATRSRTPLRCQESPKSMDIRDLLDKNASLVHLSVHLSCQADATRLDSQTMRGQSLSRHYASTSNPMADVSETFPILISLLTSLKAAARDKDIYRIIDLITTDDIHPQLLPFTIAFRQLFQKSYFLRSNSTYASRIGHSDLNLDSYTQASSPIRRYLDIIVQRLLHSVIDKTDVSYTSNDINMSCVEFSRNNDHQSAYDKKAHALHFASKLSTQHERKVAYIVEVIPSGTNFKVSFPLNRASMPDKTGIMYRDLQLADQPEYDERNNVILKWVRRIYSFSNPDIHAELQKQSSDSILAYVPAEFWQKLVAAIREEKWNSLFDLIKDLDVDSTTHGKQFQEHSRRTEGHYAKLSLRLKQGEAVEVQLGTTTAFTMMTPVVQVFVVHPKFELCMEHVRDPIKCFSEYVFRSSRDSYNSFVEYQTIWALLCQMESVFNAVAENESIVLEDVALKWKTSQQEKLQGLFVLPFDKMKQWSIECDLENCSLCIRRRNCKGKCSPVLKNITDLTNNPSVIWVSHGVVTKVEGTESSDIKIAFQINHMAMTNIPEEIFCEDTRFTVELIPELLPDVRKKKAIDSLNDANQLVRNIAMGKKVNSERGSLSWDQMPTRFEIQHLAFRFSLNNSQCKAIREALTNPFTLIQGPPGTGKTVVGVHIVFWLLKKIQALAGSNFQKKRAILYCGPSNKSVDVAAGHLLKLNETRPLRVYSDQMEMLEFPYPGCSLKLSRQSKRAEKPNTELSSIALHHLIRKDGNPFSKVIQDFDKRIQREEQLTKEEISCYKDLLIKAREHELLQHDVILCTCTAASHPLLAKVLDIKQIIIDECAMATEPEAFIPLVTHKPEQIVLLGDHMQLQPVVHCDVVARLGMNKSLFERYMEKALMLDTQYRMQEAICAFPSEEFYGGQLQTAKTHKQGLFLNEAQRPTHIIFGHVEGKEISLVVSTERGNENSKANVEEAKETVRIAKDLIQAGISAQDIAILTPYNAQVSNISEMLFKKGLCDITVTTIMKSQGSEWKYVILSTVRSCPQSDIEPQPTKSWITSRLGFITDRHQVNVGITRAQEGLCIIGNENLLRCNALWRKLLDHYQKKRCVMNPASNIQVQKPQSGPVRTYRR